MTASWQGLQTAPRDGREVWLFLPEAKFEASADGIVTGVRHVAAAARWDKARGAWIGRESGHEVYPSLWSDADTAGALPDFPQMEAHAAR